MFLILTKEQLLHYAEYLHQDYTTHEEQNYSLNFYLGLTLFLITLLKLILIMYGTNHRRTIFSCSSRKYQGAFFFWYVKEAEELEKAFSNVILLGLSPQNGSGVGKEKVKHSRSIKGLRNKNCYQRRTWHRFLFQRLHLVHIKQNAPLFLMGLCVSKQRPLLTKSRR